MDVNMPGTAKMPVTTSSAETFIGLTESNKDRRLPTPRLRSINRIQVDQLIERFKGNKIIERSIAMEIRRKQSVSVIHMTVSPDM